MHFPEESDVDQNSADFSQLYLLGELTEEVGDFRRCSAAQEKCCLQAYSKYFVKRTDADLDLFGMLH